MVRENLLPIAVKLEIDHQVGPDFKENSLKALFPLKLGFCYQAKIFLKNTLNFVIKYFYKSFTNLSCFLVSVIKKDQITILTFVSILDFYQMLNTNINYNNYFIHEMLFNHFLLSRSTKCAHSFKFLLGMDVSTVLVNSLILYF